MPRLSPPADPGAVWAELSPTQRAAVREMLADLDVPQDTWPAVPAMRMLMESVAVARRARSAELCGLSPAAGLRDACSWFDADIETVTKRLTRWRRAGRTSLSREIRRLVGNLKMAHNAQRNADTLEGQWISRQ
jgi:hypothetical protein